MNEWHRIHFIGVNRACHIKLQISNIFNAGMDKNSMFCEMEKRREKKRLHSVHTTVHRMCYACRHRSRQERVCAITQFASSERKNVCIYIQCKRQNNNNNENGKNIKRNNAIEGKMCGAKKDACERMEMGESVEQKRFRKIKQFVRIKIATIACSPHSGS